MYNDRRYSLARYSVNQETKTVEIAESFSEAMGAVAGAAIPVDFRDKYAEALQGSARGTVSVISAFSAASGLFTTAKMSADVVTRAALSEALRGSMYGQKNTPAALTARDTLTAQAQGAKNVPALLKGSEVLTSMLEATSQTTERTTLQLTIPPGGELRIDSGLFLVLLDGENALHTQSGDWINISRDLLRLIIESASGGQLRGQLIYTERYL